MCQRYFAQRSTSLRQNQNQTLNPSFSVRVRSGLGLCFVLVMYSAGQKISLAHLFGRVAPFPLIPRFPLFRNVKSFKINFQKGETFKLINTRKFAFRVHKCRIEQKSKPPKFLNNRSFPDSDKYRLKSLFVGLMEKHLQNSKDKFSK